MPDKVFDEKTRRALAGLLPFAEGSKAPFTPKAFETVAEELRPTFWIRPYSPEAWKARILSDKSKEGLFVDYLREVFETEGLIGWDNLLDGATGKPIPYNLENVKRLPPNLCLFLDEEIL